VINSLTAESNQLSMKLISLVQRSSAAAVRVVRLHTSQGTRSGITKLSVTSSSIDTMTKILNMKDSSEHCLKLYSQKLTLLDRKQTWRTYTTRDGRILVSSRRIPVLTLEEVAF
jgi:hypothetical protein